MNDNEWYVIEIQISQVLELLADAHARQVEQWSNAECILLEMSFCHRNDLPLPNLPSRAAHKPTLLDARHK